MTGCDSPSLFAWNPDKAKSLDLTITVDAAYEAKEVWPLLTFYTAEGVERTRMMLDSPGRWVCGSHGPLTLHFSVEGIVGLEAGASGIFYYSVQVCIPQTTPISGYSWDSDSDKVSNHYLQSKLISLTPTGDDGTTATYDVEYCIGDVLQAESAVLEFYDTDSKLRWSQSVDPHASGVIFYDLLLGGVTISIELPSGIPGTLVLQVKDGSNRLDKNQGHRPVLQSGKLNVLSYVVGFFHEDYTADVYDEPQILKKAFQYFNVPRDFNLPDQSTVYNERSVWGGSEPTAADIQNAVGATYHALPDLLAQDDNNHNAWYFQGSGVDKAAEVSIRTMQQAFLHASSRTQEGQQRPLRVLSFGGHSDYNGGQIRIRANNHTDPNTRLLVPSAAYHQDQSKRDYLNTTTNVDYPISNFAAEEMEEMIPSRASAVNKDHGFPVNIPTANLLDNLDLAILIGCTVGMGNNSPLADEFIKMGAKSVLRLGNTLSHLGAESVFMTYFTAALRRQNTTISLAAAEANNKAAKFMAGRDAAAYGNMQTDYKVVGPGQNNVLKP